MTGTRMSGCVLRQNDTIDTQMKNTEIIPIIYENEWKFYIEWKCKI